MRTSDIYNIVTYVILVCFYTIIFLKSVKDTIVREQIYFLIKIQHTRINQEG